jgi:hypothetical protein
MNVQEKVPLNVLSHRGNPFLDSDRVLPVSWLKSCVYRIVTVSHRIKKPKVKTALAVQAPDGMPITATVSDCRSPDSHFGPTCPVILLTRRQPCELPDSLTWIARRT